MDPALLTLAGVAGVAIIVAVSAFSSRLGVAAPILLVLIGVGVSYLPGVPAIELPHQLVLDGLLPPILYATAIRLPWVDFRRNLGTIASLSVVLVLITAFGSGLVLFALIPAVTLSLGVAVGAVISPPDAVSATAIGRRLNLPPRLLAVLEGEGLVNDATALTLFGTALAFVSTETSQRPGPVETVGQFALSAVIAMVIGFVVGALTVFVRARLNDPVLGTAISLAVPFLAFAPTTALNASGVLAVVVAGLYTGHANPSSFSPVVRISDRINWRTIQFLLENAVFLLIGLQIKTLIEQVDDAGLSVPQTFGLGLLTTVVLILLRFLWVGPLVLLLRAREHHAEAATLNALLALQARVREPGRPRRKRLNRERRAYVRRRADLEQLRSQTLDWRSGVVLSWSGMRGVVTLAAAQSLATAENLPSEIERYLPQLILIAFTVAVVTLVVQGGTLPALIRLLRIEGVDETNDRRLLADLLEELRDTGLSVLDDPTDLLDDATEIPGEVLERVRRSSSIHVESAQERSRGEQPLEATPQRLYRRLRLAVLQAEREHLLELRDRGTYPPRIEAEAQALLDLEETRLRPVRDAG